jgi:hypothetical protein
VLYLVIAEMKSLSDDLEMTRAALDHFDTTL